MFVFRPLLLGLGSWKSLKEPPLRNELTEAGPWTAAVPDVDVSSSKPTQKKVKGLKLVNAEEGEGVQ